jgi:hypothetical protein
MAFMVPEYTKERMWLVETSYGTEVVPADLLPKSWQKVDVITLGPESEGFEAVFDYLEGSDPSELALVKGKWFARLSAPGYMDRTDWHGPFDTKKEAEQDIEDSYDVDPKTGDELEVNPNRRDVIRAWAEGRKAKASALRTEGGKLWSYDLLIGDTKKGKRIVYDYMGPQKVSATTSQHVSAAKSVADEVRKPPKGRVGQVVMQPPARGNPGVRPPSEAKMKAARKRMDALGKRVFSQADFDMASRGDPIVRRYLETEYIGFVANPRRGADESLPPGHPRLFGGLKSSISKGDWITVWSPGPTRDRAARVLKVPLDGGRVGAKYRIKYIRGGEATVVEEHIWRRPKPKRKATSKLYSGKKRSKKKTSKRKRNPVSVRKLVNDALK